MKDKINKNMTLGQVVSKYPESVDILMKYGLHCMGCSVSAFETLEQGSMAHGIYGEDFDEMLNELNEVIDENIN